MVVVLANAIRCNGLVLCEVQANGHSFDRSACKLHGLVNSLCFEEFHVSKLPIAQLVHAQGYHLYLPARLKEIDQILLRCINGDVANPKRVAICWFDALRSVSPAAGSLCLTLRIVCDLVHVREVELNTRSIEILTYLLHGPINAFGVGELHMSKVATDHTFTQTDLSDLTRVCEEILQIIFFGFLIDPSHPDSPATLRLWTPVIFSSSTTTCRWRPTTTALFLLTTSARLPASARATTASPTPTTPRGTTAATAAGAKAAPRRRRPALRWWRAPPPSLGWCRAWRGA